MHFTLRQIEVFAAIAKLNSVSIASERLSMSQSAASTALAELERRAAQPLFDRVGKRLRLNEIGHALLPKALEMLDRADELDALLEGRAGPGHLNLGATVTIGNYLAPWIVEQYLQANAGASVDLDVGNTSSMAARVAQFDLDLALIEGEYSDPDLIITEWLDDELVIFCAPTHRLATKRKATIEDVLAERWAVREKGSGTRQTLDRALEDHWGQWQIGMQLEHIEAIKTAVETGSMIGCVSRLALKDALASGRLVEIPVQELSLRRHFYTVIHRNKYRTASIDAFLKTCTGQDWVRNG